MRHTCNDARHRPYRSRALGCLACSVPVACALSFSDLPAGLRLQHTIVSVSKQRDAEHHDHSDHDAPHCMCHSMTFNRLLTQISVLTKCPIKIIPSTSPHVCTPKDFCGFRISENLRRITNRGSGIRTISTVSYRILARSDVASQASTDHRERIVLTRTFIWRTPGSISALSLVVYTRGMAGAHASVWILRRNYVPKHK